MSATKRDLLDWLWTCILHHKKYPLSQSRDAYICLLKDCTGSDFSKAVGLIDKKLIEILEFKIDGEEVLSFLFQVRGNHDNVFSVIPSYCTCPYFQHHLNKSTSDLTCKHEIAVMLVMTMNLKDRSEASSTFSGLSSNTAIDSVKTINVDSSNIPELLRILTTNYERIQSIA
eukprot:GHVP01040963.1.p1 GENE.GHVP01040963.1~~GHVP01040963.1.p1  ORF type:complete len:172 (-),score=19.83 GHVP01040963.1:227-742(-)